MSCARRAKGSVKYILFIGIKVALRERERRLLLSWAKAGNDSKGRNKATRSEGDDLGDSAARALMRQRRRAFFFEGGGKARLTFKKQVRSSSPSRASHRAALRTTYRTLPLVPSWRATRGRAPNLEPA